MHFDKAKEIYELLFTFMGLFHEKFFYRLRREAMWQPGLKKNHTKIMNILYQYDHITLTEIGKMLDIEKGSLTTLIDWLEENDWVIRQNDPQDRRKTLISLSAKGRDEIDRVINCHVEKMGERFSNVDPAEIEQFVQSLDAVVKFMKKI